MPGPIPAARTPELTPRGGRAKVMVSESFVWPHSSTDVAAAVAADREESTDGGPPCPFGAGFPSVRIRGCSRGHNTAQHGRLECQPNRHPTGVNLHSVAFAHF
jgi:hypothetical protein